jgi:hypothetical protein
MRSSDLMSASMIDEGWAALHAGDAATARDAFENALAEAETGSAREGLGQALCLQRDYSAAIAQNERAYTAFRREVKPLQRPEWRASWHGSPAMWSAIGQCRTDGWPGHSGSSPKAGRTPPEHGWVLIIRSYTEPDAAAREAMFSEAISLGRRFADPNIEIESLASLAGLYHPPRGQAVSAML